MARDRSPEDQGRRDAQAGVPGPRVLRKTVRPSKRRPATDEADDPEAEDALRDATAAMNRRHDAESPDLGVGVDF